MILLILLLIVLLIVLLNLLVMITDTPPTKSISERIVKISWFYQNCGYFDEKKKNLEGKCFQLIWDA